MEGLTKSVSAVSGCGPLHVVDLSNTAAITSPMNGCSLALQSDLTATNLQHQTPLYSCCRSVAADAQLRRHTQHRPVHCTAAPDMRTLLLCCLKVLLRVFTGRHTQRHPVHCTAANLEHQT
jgi:hypothetical protein